MKKLIALCLIPAAVYADPFQSQKPVICEDSEVVLATLAEKYNESVAWMGKDLKNGNAHILTINEKEGTWTYIETNGQTACILGTGTKSTPMFGVKT
mgnify:CR=1 FL=1